MCGQGAYLPESETAFPITEHRAIHRGLGGAGHRAEQAFYRPAKHRV